MAQQVKSERVRVYVRLARATHETLLQYSMHVVQG